MATDVDEQLVGLTGDERIVMEVRLNFQRCKDFYGKADANSLEDTKFANADSRNHWQWPDKIYNERGEERPSLTINKTRVHNDMIVNESLQNKSSIKIRPTGGQASYEAAQAVQAMIRRIEYISKGDSVYEKAIRDQVDGGIGYVLIDTAYTSERSRDQDIYLRRCRDPRSVYLDPDISEADGSDANFGIVFDPMSRAKFNRKYPKFRNKIGNSALGNDETWIGADTVMLAMYHRRKGTKDVFISFIAENGERVEKLKSEIKDEAGAEIFDGLMAQIDNGELDGYKRDVINQDVEWFLIGGDQIIDRGKWAGKYIPICRCVGIETFIEGVYDRKGHTRALIDPQRMLNYNASGSIEFGALQNKVPYVGPARAFEGQEEWKDANRKNYAYLQYNDIDEEAEGELARIEAPQRQPAPQTAPVYLQGMQDSERQMMMVSGQYQAQMGEEDHQSATSGKAISERQRQGDTATYHFVEHQADMYRFIGVQLLDLIPKIYDTERELHVLGEDGAKRWIKIAPDQKEAAIELQEERDEAAIISLNPSIGEYDCMSDVGPNYATQRQEAWNAISLILQQNMQLAGTIGDLLFKFGDFPGADEIMERLKKEIQATKPYLFDDKVEPQMVALQEQMKRLTGLNAELMHKLSMKDIALKGRDEKRDIEAFNAETKRLAMTVDALAKLMLTPQQREQMEHEISLRSHDATMTMITDINAAELQPVGATGSDQ